MSKTSSDNENGATNKLVDQKQPNQQHLKDPLETASKSSSGSYCKSPKSKTSKMVHIEESATPSSTCSINDVYIKQLEAMKTRVNLLELEGSEEFELKCRSAPSRLEKICKIPSTQSLDLIDEASIDDSYEKLEIFTEEETEKNIDSENNSFDNDSIEVNYIWTPRMKEVPPKKHCTRSVTPEISPKILPPIVNPNLRQLKHKSIWTNTIGGSNYEDKATNTEGDFKNTRQLHEDLDRIQAWEEVNSIKNNLNVPEQKTRSTFPLEPKVIVLSNSSSTSEMTKDYERILQTPSDITSINSPSLIVSPLVSPKENDFNPLNTIQGAENISIFPNDKTQMWIEEMPQKKNNLSQFCEISHIPPTSYIVAPFRSAIRDLSASVKRILNRGNDNNATSNQQELKSDKGEEQLEYIPDEVEVNFINYSDYDIPLKRLGEKLTSKCIKDVVSNLALHVFKSKETIENDDVEKATVEDDDVEKQTVEDTPNRVSYKEVAQKVSLESTEAQDRRRQLENILDENIKTFRSRNIGLERRPQATNFGFYNVTSSKFQAEEGAGDVMCRHDIEIENEDLDAEVDEETEDDEDADEDVRIVCCSFKTCLEFMFPKRRQTFF